LAQKSTICHPHSQLPKYFAESVSSTRSWVILPDHIFIFLLVSMVFILLSIFILYFYNPPHAKVMCKTFSVKMHIC